MSFSNEILPDSLILINDIKYKKVKFQTKLEINI